MSELTLQQQYDLLQEKMQALEKKHNTFVHKTMKMRQYQAQYFAYRASSDLKSSKRLEHEIDLLIAEEVKQIKSNQQELF